jgi:hypothetical protein
MLLSVSKRVFTQTRYIQIAILVAVLALSVAILLPNVSVIVQVLQSSNIDVAAKLIFLGSMYGALFTNFTLFSALATLAISTLFGINSALLAYYIRRRQAGVSNTGGHTAGVLGVVSGVFGIGCAACGSVIISSFLILFGAGGLLAILPFQGAEFGVLGVLLLSFSIYQLSKRIHDPLVCPS